jgi:hypothetical protein
MKSIRFFRATSSLLGVLIGLFPDLAEAADPAQFQPGDKIEYKESNYPELWEQGVFVRATPDGKQPIIRKKPNQFYKEGFETGFSWSNIRPLAARPAGNGPAGPTVHAPGTPVAGTPPTVSKPLAPPANPRSNGQLMTQRDVLDFLSQRLGPDPFSNPRREEIKKELAGLIKARGLDFRYEAVSAFSTQLSKFGVSSEITFPLGDNFGPPTQQPWLLGSWKLDKIGATVDYVRGDKRYRQSEIGVKDVGALTIHVDGKYTWESGAPTGPIRGDWRRATPMEMKYQGGDGLVLLKAKSGWDWIVHQDRTTRLEGRWINIAELATRQVRESGFRDSREQ